MEDKLEMRYIVRIFLTAIGAYGIVSVLTSCALPAVSDIMMLFCVGIYSSLCVVGIYTKKWAKKYMMTAGIVFAALAVLCIGILKKGICYIYNDCMYALEKAYQLDLGRIPIEDTIAKAVCENITMLFIAFLITLMVTVVVVYLHSMLGALLSVLPVMILFVSMASIPDSLSFFLCIAYIFGVSALHGQQGGERQSLAVLGLCMAAAAAAVLIMPPAYFERLPVFETLNEEAKQRFSWVGGEFLASNMQATANGGINRGELGKINGIRYTNETVLTLTTSDIGKNQYFSTFIGQTYENNQWSETLSTTLKSDTKEELVDVMDANETLQGYIDGGRGTYYDIVKKFPYEIDFVNGDKQSGMYISADVSSYGVFKNMTGYLKEKDLDYEAYYRRQLSNQEKIYANYLSVPEQTADIINGLMGNVTVTTQEQKEYYIKYVKDYLAANYTYNIMPGKVPAGKDFTEYFLLENKQGYCTYFATAAVMMYRCAGIPARYVEGYVVAENAIKKGRNYQTVLTRYTTGGGRKKVANTNYVLELQDNAAHAWVEVYMDDYGWVTVEVTPPSGAAGTVRGTENRQPVSAATQEEVRQETQSAQETQPATTQTMQASEAATETEETTAIAASGTDTPSAESSDALGGKEGSKKDSFVTALSNPAVLIPCAAVLAIIGIFLIIFIRYFIVIQIRMHKKRKCDLKAREQQQFGQMILSEYRRLEKIIAFAGFGRTGGLEYEVYAGYLSEASDVFRRNHIKEIMELVLKISFSDVSVSENEYREFRKNIRRIRYEIYRKQGLLGKFCFKYIKIY